MSECASPQAAVDGDVGPAPRCDAPRRGRIVVAMSLAAVYVEFLEREGFRPTIDDAGDVLFRCEGRCYYLMVDDDDPTYFRLLFPNFWSIDGALEHQRALLAAADVTAEIKVAKIYVLGDDTQAAAEMFLADPDRLHRDLPRVFDRALRALQGAVHRFCELMQDRRPRLRLVEGNNN